jgi:hypothetical protein
MLPCMLSEDLWDGRVNDSLSQIVAGVQSRHHSRMLQFVPWEAAKEEGP